MDNFDKIIKEKLESFNVPFNEAHWAQMDAKLNAAKTANFTRNVSIAASVIAVVAISAYFLTNLSSTKEKEIVSHNEVQLENKEITIPQPKHTEQPTIHPEETTPSDSKTISEKLSVIDENSLENNSISNEEETPFTASSEEEKDVAKSTYQSVEEEKIRVEIANPTVCQEQTVSFKAYADGYSPSFLWDFGDGQTSDEAHPKHVYKADGVYDVTLSVTYEKSGKSITKQKKSTVTVLPIPKEDFNYTEQSLLNDRNKIMYPYTTLFVELKNIKAYIWNVGNGKISTKPTPEFLFDKKGEYPIKVTLTHQSGCEVTFTKSIEIQQDFDLLAPTGIIPNHNITERTTFLPKALYTWDIKFEMIISDKSGKEIYRTSESTAPWNGKLNNTGETLPEDIYIWKVITYDAKGLPHTHTGKVKLEMQ